MAHILGKRFLRVRTPVLIEGKRPKYTNGQMEFTETHLPLTAKKHLDRENRHLLAAVGEEFQHVISIINEDEATTPVKGKGVSMSNEDEKKALLARLRELGALPAELGQTEPAAPVAEVKRGPGRPPAAKTTADMQGVGADDASNLI